MALTALLVGLAVGVGPATAHLPEGRIIGVPHIADAQLPVVDGSLDEWAALPPLLETDDFTDLVSEASVDAADLGIRVWLGWNDAANRLWVAAQVTDDVRQVDRPAGTATTRIFQDDDLEIFLDPDHSGGQYADLSHLSPAEQLERNGTEASHFVLAGPHPDGDHFVNFSAAGWYALEDGLYTGAAVAFDGMDGGAGVTSYEAFFVPFDQINVTADFLSRSHDMQAGEVLGFNLEVSDFDTSPDLYDAKWSLSGGFNAFRLSERFTDILLLAAEDGETAVEDISWGRIKASIGAR